MPTATASSGIPERIQALLHQRQQHANAIAAIDQTLRQIHTLLGKPGAAHITGKRASPMPPAVLTPDRRRHKRGRYAMTAEQSILAFVKQHGSPTTAQIRAHWRSEGRKGTADNVLSRLVKTRKLKRTPLQGDRGSRYSLA